MYFPKQFSSWRKHLYIILILAGLTAQTFKVSDAVVLSGTIKIENRIGVSATFYYSFIR
jgi:hypothetical protein